MARASLFGPFRLFASDGSEIAISNRRAKAMLGMLCLAGDRPIEREALSRMLWPGRFGAHAKASLRQCLLDLRKLLEPIGSDLVDATRATVGLTPGTVATDLSILEQSLAANQCEVAARHLKAAGAAPLLADMDFGDPFNIWLAGARDRAGDRLMEAVDSALAAARLAGDHAGHDALASAWAQRMSTARTGHAVPLTVEGARIAVLPFRALGAAGEQDYFADGLVDELITALGQVPELLVAGRTSSFHFRDSALPPPRIAAELGVSHLVEGSVQRQGDRVRIHVHLIAGSTGFELFGTRLDGTTEDVFALQEDLAGAITEAIGSALGIAIRRPKIAGMTQNKEAYDLFLQGRALCARLFGEGVLDTAVTLFEKALDLDPDFAECWVALAEAHQLVAVYTQCLDRNAAAARMAECARKAIALAPQLGYPHALLGVYELTRNNFTRAIDYGFEAYRLDPHDPAVAMRLAYFLIFIGRTRDAAPYIKAAVDRDPVDGRKYGLLWGVQFCMGDLDAASISAQRMVDLGMMSVTQGVTSAAQGKHALAVEQYLQNQQVLNDMILPPVGLGIQTPEAMAAYWNVAANGICSGRQEDRNTYWQLLEMLYAVLHDKSDLAISGPAVFSGNAELVFKTLGHSITPSNLMALVPFWADTDPIRQIRQHPGFMPFAQQIGMAAAWEKYGWPDLLPPPDNHRATN